MKNKVIAWMLRKRFNKCNHIIGIKSSRFKDNDEVVYENEYFKNKYRFRGQIFWKCPLCKKTIWIWVSKYDSKIGHYRIKKYIGYKI